MIFRANKKCLSGRIVMNANVERTTIRKGLSAVAAALLFVSYFVCYLDRIIMSALRRWTMNKDLGFTATVFALAATAFFWGYCLCSEIPSNIVLEKIGARACGSPAS